MAASYTWPATLPAPLIDMGEDVGLNILTSPMDKGPAKERYRGERPQQLSLSFAMTDAQVSTLDTFARTTTRGVSRFYFTHPRTGSTVEARFKKDDGGRLYSTAFLAPGYWKVAFMLEVLP